jgi:glycosyltransferase involved in cell wall biosynthesis
LERLINAWAQLSAFHGEWQLVLAGPDEGGYRAVIETRIDRLQCRSSVRLLGTLDNRSKWAVLQAADLFIMPSDFENFGMSIVEAMLADKPVITTTGTPWQSLAEQGAGWWVERTPEALTDAMIEAMTLSDESRQAMGRRGCGLAAQFTPDKVASQLAALYSWVLKEGAQPDFVRLD